MLEQIVCLEHLFFTDDLSGLRLEIERQNHENNELSLIFGILVERIYGIHRKSTFNAEKLYYELQNNNKDTELLVKFGIIYLFVYPTTIFPKEMTSDLEEISKYIESVFQQYKMDQILFTYYREWSIFYSIIKANYLQHKNPEEALHVVTSAIDNTRSINNIFLSSYGFFVNARIYCNQADFDNTILTLNEGKCENYRVGSAYIDANLDYLMAITLHKQRKYNLSLSIMGNTVKLIEDNQFTFIDLIGFYRDHFKETGDVETGIHYFEKKLTSNRDLPLILYQIQAILGKLHEYKNNKELSDHYYNESTLTLKQISIVEPHVFGP